MGSILAMIVKALSDSLLQAAANLIQGEMQKRQLVAQGEAQQHTADLEQSVKEATSAAATDEKVVALDDARLNSGLQRVRDTAAGS